MAARKILIVTNRVPFPFKDGGNLAMHAMIEGYNREGWEVYLLSMNTTRHFVKHDQLATLYTHLHRFEWVDIDNRVRPLSVIKNYLFSKEPEHAKRFYHESFRAKLEQICRSFNPDVVQFESVFLSTYLETVKMSCEALTVLRMHNVEYQIWQSLAKKFRNRIKQFYLESLSRRVRNFERRFWGQYDLLLTITEKDASLVNRLEDVNRMIVAPFSIDLNEIAPSSRDEKWVGYHIGAMDWMPNNEGLHWFLENAWPAIHKTLPRFEFYFAGRSMPEDFRKLDIPGVHCMNEVPSAADFIADKKILIVPIWSGGGIRVKILEAMAVSKVVITTATGIKGIDARPGEHFLLVQKPADFVRAIKWCLNNKQAAENMAHKASELIKNKYEHSKVIQTVITELDTMLNSRN
jgi:glycosyltransferase involved in cell wall biosynthesis